MTCEQAKAAMCIWAYGRMLNAAIAGQIDELTHCGLAMQSAPVCSNPDLTGIRVRRYGDGVGFTVGMSERIKRRIEYLRGMARYIRGVYDMVNGCIPDDSAMRRAMRERCRTSSNWRRVGEVCGVNNAAAREVYNAALRSLTEYPWTCREAVTVAFALRLVKSNAALNTLRSAGAN